MKVLISTLALLVVFALPAEAQLSLQISNGRVTLDAKNVPARQILSEWARIGGTKIVGGDKVTGAPLTLKLADMPEKQALEVILRNVAGFMAAPRLASAIPGASAVSNCQAVCERAISCRSRYSLRQPRRIPGTMKTSRSNRS